MQSLIVITAVLIGCYVIVWIKNHRHNFTTSLRALSKRFARRVMSCSWVIALMAIVLIVCYPNASGFLKEMLSAQSVRDIKSLTRVVFGVDSSFVALQMLAIYSIMASFVSCLVLSGGAIVRVVYTTVSKLTRASSVDVDCSGCFEDFAPHLTPTFKLYLRFNS